MGRERFGRSFTAEEAAELFEGRGGDHGVQALVAEVVVVAHGQTRLVVLPPDIFKISVHVDTFPVVHVEQFAPSRKSFPASVRAEGCVPQHFTLVDEPLASQGHDFWVVVLSKSKGLRSPVSPDSEGQTLFILKFSEDLSAEDGAGRAVSPVQRSGGVSVRSEYNIVTRSMMFLVGTEAQQLRQTLVLPSASLDLPPTNSVAHQSGPQWWISEHLTLSRSFFGRFPSVPQSCIATVP